MQSVYILDGPISIADFDRFLEKNKKKSLIFWKCSRVELHREYRFAWPKLYHIPVFVAQRTDPPKRRLCTLMSAEADFYNNFDIWKYFFRQKKLIRILSRAFLESCQFSILENCDINIWAPQTGKATDGQNEFFF